MGGSRDVRRACEGLVEPVGTSLAVVSGLCKNGGALGLVLGFYERRRMNTSDHKNRGKVTTFGAIVAMFLRVIIPTSRRSRMWKCQRCDVGIKRCDVPESPLSQRRDVLERVEI